MDHKFGSKLTKMLKQDPNSEQKGSDKVQNGSDLLRKCFLNGQNMVQWWSKWFNYGFKRSKYARIKIKYGLKRFKYGLKSFKYGPKNFNNGPIRHTYQKS